MSRLCHTLSVFLLTTLYIGCAHVQPNYTLTMEGSAGRIAQAIIKGMPPAYRGITMLVATPVEATTLDVGDFGLAMQELFIGAMTQKGANVVEVQLRKVPYISNDKGLIYLSRDATKLRDEYKAGMILVSSYVKRKHDVVITARIVDLSNNDIIASATTALYRSSSVNELLEAKGGEKVYER